MKLLLLSEDANYWERHVNQRCEEVPTFGDLSGVAFLSAEGHADIHVVGGGVGQVLCAAVHGAAAD